MNDDRNAGKRGPAVAAAALSIALVLGGLQLLADPLSLRSKSIKITYLARIHEPAWAWGSEAALCVRDKRLYVPLGYPGLTIFDISKPASPVRLGNMHSQALGGQAGAVAVAGSRAYVALPDKDRIAVLDLTDPSHPKVLARAKGAPGIQQLQVRGEYLYAYCGSHVGQNGGVFAYKISGAKLTAAGKYAADLIDPGFFISTEGTAFIARTPATAGDSAKVECVDMSRPAAPVFLGRWTSSYPGNITDMDLKKNRIYCSAFWGGLWILDASDTSALKLAASFDWNAPQPYAISVKAYPPYVFVAQGGPTLADQKFVFFKDAGTSVRLWRQVAASTYTHSVALSGNLLFLVEQEPAGTNPNPQKIVRVYRIKTGLASQGRASLRRDGGAGPR